MIGIVIYFKGVSVNYSSKFDFQKNRVSNHLSKILNCYYFLFKFRILQELLFSNFSANSKQKFNSKHSALIWAKLKYVSKFCFSKTVKKQFLQNFKLKQKIAIIEYFWWVIGYPIFPKQKQLFYIMSLCFKISQ